ncbi:class I histocompatibility antigen, F10 alpha chain-like isoform X2 [Heptranchias perlo]|uniref:class I histocompatibility antigen, F10 alpha chain-like isoform X2 n=2 Tax=Heptranchias perlo TaxID=212740 RepID=UPI00355A68A2
MLLILFSISLCFSRVSPDSDSFTVVYTGISGNTDGPEFAGVTMVNGVVLTYYDSDTQQVVSRQQFVTDSFDVEQWNYINRQRKKRHDVTMENLSTILKWTNKTSGIHIFQWIRNVEISEDGSIKRSMRFGYDGKDYISLEPDRMRWVATNHLAVKTKEKWDSDDSWNNYWKWQLEEELVDVLQLYLRAGKEYLKRKVQPEVFISRSDPNNQYNPPTLSCLVTGFYPVNIEVTWLRNGEQVSESQSSGVRPNHDGTHQIKKEIEVNAGDEDQYSCQIEHSSLAEAKVYQWERPENRESNLGIIIGSVIAALAVIVVIIGIVIWKRQRRASEVSDRSPPLALTDCLVPLHSFPRQFTVNHCRMFTEPCCWVTGLTCTSVKRAHHRHSSFHIAEDTQNISSCNTILENVRLCTLAGKIREQVIILM